MGSSRKYIECSTMSQKSISQLEALGNLHFKVGQQKSKTTQNILFQSFTYSQSEHFATKNISFFLLQTWSIAFVVWCFMINTHVPNLFWMETNRIPVFPLPAIQGLAKFDALRNARRWKMKMCREDLFLTTHTFKNGRILFYKASPVFWTMFCTCSKTPTTWSKKCIISVLPFFSAGDSPQRHLRCLFFVVVVRRIKKKKKKKNVWHVLWWACLLECLPVFRGRQKLLIVLSTNN